MKKIILALVLMSLFFVPSAMAFSVEGFFNSVWSTFSDWFNLGLTIEQTRSGDGIYSVENGLLVGSGTFSTRVGSSSTSPEGTLRLNSPSIYIDSFFTEADCLGIGGQLLQSEVRNSCSVGPIHGCILTDYSSHAPGLNTGVMIEKTTLSSWTVAASNPSSVSESYSEVHVELEWDCPSVREYYDAHSFIGYYPDSGDPSPPETSSGDTSIGTASTSPAGWFIVALIVLVSLFFIPATSGIFKYIMSFITRFLPLVFLVLALFIAYRSFVV
jgi:hypothetical protein